MQDILRFDGSVKRDPKIDIWFDEQSPEWGALARSWFERLRTSGGDVRELMHDGLATVCVGDAPFAYVGIYKHHIGVGFFHGAALKDPARLLEGSGKRMRHVKLKAGQTIDAAALDDLIKAAYADIRERLDAP